MAKVTFDGVNRTITVDPGVTALDIRIDVYSDWKEWVQIGNNSIYPAAIRTVGGDTIDEFGGIFAGDLYFLINNWTLAVDVTETRITGILYSDDFESAYTDKSATPIFPPVVSSIVNTVATGALSQEQIAAGVWGADYTLYDTDGTMGHLVNYISHLQKSIWLDTSLVTNGDGSQETPFNNLTDAIDHAEANNIRELVLLSDIVLDRDLKNFTVRGIGIPEFDAAGYDLKGCDLNKVRFKGLYTDSVIVQESVLDDGCYLQGYFENCALAGTIRPTATGQALLKNCTSNNTLAVPTLDMTGSTCHVSIQEFTGSIDVSGIDQASAVVHIAGTSANVTADVTCTLGELMVNGFVNFVDNTNGTTVIDNTGANVDTSGMTVTVDYDAVSDAVWNKQLASLLVADSTGERLKALLTLNQYLGLK